MKALSTNSLDWFYYPIIIPMTEDDHGPAVIGEDAVKLVYEVWDQELTTHGRYETLYKAINAAMELELRRLRSND